MEITKILEGNVRAAAKLMRGIEDGAPPAVEGLTGAPGAGKSTLIDTLISALRRKKYDSWYYCAIDPTSPFTGGAIVGDRIRMQRHSTDQGVFMQLISLSLTKPIGMAPTS